MKTLLLTVLLFLLTAMPNLVSAQSKAATPAKNSLVRQAIYAVVKKKFPKMKKEDTFLVQGNWARIVYDVKADGSSNVNVILKKTGKTWKIVFDHNHGSDDGDDVDDYIKGVPAKLKIRGAIELLKLDRRHQESEIRSGNPWQII